MHGDDKFWPKKLKMVEYRGSSLKGEKGTLGSKFSVLVNGEWDVSISSITYSMLINPGGNSVITINFLRGEGGSGLGAIKAKGDSSWENSDLGCLISSSVSSVFEASLVLDYVWPNLLISGPE